MNKFSKINLFEAMDIRSMSSNELIAMIKSGKGKSANLAGADFRGANLTSAKLVGVNLSGADFEGVTYDAKTLWPRGFRPPRSR